MKYIREYNDFKNYNRLNNEEYLVNYILGINESYSLNESIIDRIKKVAKKGALTAGVVATLLSSPSFSQEYNKLNEPQRIELVNTINENGEMVVNIADEFKSGEYEIKNIDDIKSRIQPLIDYSKMYDDSKLEIKVEASESKVPNRDIKTKEKLPAGELSKRRFKSVENVISQIFPGINIAKDIKTSGPEWENDNPNDEKYKKHQYVKIHLYLTGCPLCDFQVSLSGEQSQKEKKFTGTNYNLSISGKKSNKGQIIINTGSIPDRVIAYEDGKEIGDTGYYSDEEHQYDGVRYVPLYVKELSSRAKKHKNLKAFQNIEFKTVNSVEELVDILFSDKSILDENYRVTAGPKYMDEVTSPFNDMKGHIERNGSIDIVLYKTTKQNIDFDLNKDSKSLNIKVFSPVGKTGYDGYIKCDKP